MSAQDESEMNPWYAAVVGPDGRKAFGSSSSVSGLWSGLGEASKYTTDESARLVLELLGRVASMYVRPNDWQQPYGPAMSFDDRRTAMHTDFTEMEIEILTACVAGIPHAPFRSRVYDVLALHSEGQDRVQLSLASIDALLESSILNDDWAQERDAWERALVIATRYREPAAVQLRNLEAALLGAIRPNDSGFLAVRAAEMLRRHRLGRDRATGIASTLDGISKKEKAKPDRARVYLEAAADWYEWSGDGESAQAERLLVVHSLIEEANSQEGAPSGAMRSSNLLELALRTLRGIPKAARERLGVSTLTGEIARRIRESGAASLGDMKAFPSESVDLTGVVEEARQRVTGREPLDALMAYATIYNFASFTREKESAEALLTAHPLQSLFTTVTFSHDGRKIFQSSGQGGTPVYGVDPATWKQMIQGYSFRLNLLTTGMLFPAFAQITNEHHFSIEDFAQLVAGAAIVPRSRIRQFATALYYGYDGDFSTALQLLTPQIENLVRFHLNNAGVSTTTISGDGIENEKGLSALMDASEVDTIFGADIAFEIRALFCGPVGPNLRNEVSHGLLDDNAANSGHALYAWWFALRLITTQFWSKLHDNEAAEAQEPARPTDDEWGSDGETSLDDTAAEG